MVIWLSGVSDEFFAAIERHLRRRGAVSVLDADAWDLWDVDDQADRARQGWCSDMLAWAATKVSRSGALVLLRDNLGDVDREALLGDRLRDEGVPYCRVWLNRPVTPAYAPELLAELAI